MHDILNSYSSNLAQSIPAWKEFKIVQMKGPTLFPGEVKTN